MADLTRGAVATMDTWTEGRNTSFLSKEVTLTLTGQGGTTNKITATVLGMTKIVVARSIRNSSNVIFNAAPSYDGSFILLSTGSTGTPADVTDTIRMVVVGRS